MNLKKWLSAQVGMSCNEIYDIVTLQICLGDRIEVTVLNALSSEEVSFHWHGLRHMARPHMDGVSMISQCPIMPYTSFRYEMVPESTGTHFYHAHSGTNSRLVILVIISYVPNMFINIHTIVLNHCSEPCPMVIEFIFQIWSSHFSPFRETFGMKYL